MTPRNLLKITACSVASLLVTASAATAAPTTLPLDHAVKVSGISTACTGVGERTRGEPHWRSYSVRFEAVGGYGQYLADEDVNIRGSKGQERIDVNCGAPWVLMQLPAGSYNATKHVTGAPEKTVEFAVPQHGHKDVVFRFDAKTTGKPLHRHMTSASKGARRPES
jgi:hypothetical protein